MSDFVHLRGSTYYSIKHGILSPKELVEKAKKGGYSALGIADDNNLFSAVKFFEYSRSKESSLNPVKPIIGADVWVETDVTNQEGGLKRILMIAENQSGYKKIMDLMSRSQTENQVKGRASIKQSWFDEKDNSGIIVLSGDPYNGELAQLLKTDFLIPENKQKSIEFSKKIIEFYKKNFPESFFIEVSRYDYPGEDVLVGRLFQLSKHFNVPLVATHPIMFGERKDYFTHELKVSIQDGKIVNDSNRETPFTREQYFLSKDEMKDLFSDLPESLENSVKIASRCNIKLDLGKAKMPTFPVDDTENEAQLLRNQSFDGLEKRLNKFFLGKEQQLKKEYDLYKRRLEIELSTIEKMGFSGYFLIVADFINWAKNNDVPVGPGRGSGAGSLVAYALGITDLNPIPYNLLFERFLNPDRVSLPDFDVDFETENRSRVIEYVKDRYGHDKVCQIATFGTLASRNALQMAAKSLGEPAILGKILSDIVPKKPIGLKLSEVLEKVDAFKEKYETDKRMARIIDYALKIEGMPKSVGAHAGGVVISPTKMSDFTPNFVGSSSIITTQLDMKDVEKVGLVKFDFLGLKTLSVIKKTVGLINQRNEFKDNPFKIEDIDIEDPAIYELISGGNNVKVFQLESSGITDQAKNLKPNNFEEVTALLALYRPGPLQSGMVDDFIACKKGLKEVVYPHPKLEEILKPTYGVMVYQEQIMQSAQVMANYSLGGADLLRRAMGKKMPEEMLRQRQIFEKGCGENRISKDEANKVFDLMEKFADYGFNKSHSAAYALLTVQTAFLKAHYIEEFIAASMNVDIDDTEKLSVLVADARKNNIVILPPDINLSSLDFKAVKGAIRYGLKGLKGVGSLASRIEQEREANGQYKDINDFLLRMGRSEIGAGKLKALIYAGAFDSFNPNRAAIEAAVPSLIEYISKVAKIKSEKIEGSNETSKRTVILQELFDADGVKPEAQSAPEEPVRGEGGVESGVFNKKKRGKRKDPPKFPMFPETEPWTEQEKLKYEFLVAELYISGHPFNAYEKDFGGLKQVKRMADIAAEDVADPVLVAGVVEAVKKITTKKTQKEMAFVRMGDNTGTIELTLFPDLWEDVKKEIKEGKFFAVEVALENQNIQSKQSTEDFISNSLSKDHEKDEDEDAEAVLDGEIEKPTRKQSLKGIVNHVYNDSQLADQLVSGVSVALCEQPADLNKLIEWVRRHPFSRSPGREPCLLKIYQADPASGKYHMCVVKDEKFAVDLTPEAIQDLKITFSNSQVKLDFETPYITRGRQNKKEYNSSYSNKDIQKQFNTDAVNARRDKTQETVKQESEKPLKPFMPTKQETGGVKRRVVKS